MSSGAGPVGGHRTAAQSAPAGWRDDAWQVASGERNRGPSARAARRDDGVHSGEVRRFPRAQSGALRLGPFRLLAAEVMDQRDQSGSVRPLPELAIRGREDPVEQLVLDQRAGALGILRCRLVVGPERPSHDPVAPPLEMPRQHPIVEVASADPIQRRSPQRDRTGLIRAGRSTQAVSLRKCSSTDRGRPSPASTRPTASATSSSLSSSRKPGRGAIAPLRSSGSYFISASP